MKLWITILWDEDFRKMTPAQRFVWLGLVCLAGDSKCSGKICITDTIGYNLNQLANILAVDEEDITDTIKIMGDKSLTVDKNNVITIMNWDKYQSEYMRINKSKENKEKIIYTQKYAQKYVTEGEVEGEVDKDLTTKHTIRKQFVAPTPQEATEYAKSIGFDLKGDRFCDFYEQMGWKLSNGVKMSSWKAAVRTWKNRATPISVKVDTSKEQEIERQAAERRKKLQENI